MLHYCSKLEIIIIIVQIISFLNSYYLFIKLLSSSSFIIILALTYLYSKPIYAFIMANQCHVNITQESIKQNSLKKQQQNNQQFIKNTPSQKLKNIMHNNANLQYCRKCCKYVQYRDHHCIFLGCCVQKSNYVYYITYLLYSSVLSIALFVLCVYNYHLYILSLRFLIFTAIFSLWWALVSSIYFSFLTVGLLRASFLNILSGVYTVQILKKIKIPQYTENNFFRILKTHSLSKLCTLKNISMYRQIVQKKLVVNGWKCWHKINYINLIIPIYNMISIINQRDFKSKIMSKFLSGKSFKRWILFLLLIFLNNFFSISLIQWTLLATSEKILSYWICSLVFTIFCFFHLLISMDWQIFKYTTIVFFFYSILLTLQGYYEHAKYLWISAYIIYVGIVFLWYNMVSKIKQGYMIGQIMILLICNCLFIFFLQQNSSSYSILILFVGFLIGCSIQAYFTKDYASLILSLPYNLYIYWFASIAVFLYFTTITLVDFITIQISLNIAIIFSLRCFIGCFTNRFNFYDKTCYLISTMVQFLPKCTDYFDSVVIKNLHKLSLSLVTINLYLSLLVPISFSSFYIIISILMSQIYLYSQPQRNIFVPNFIQKILKTILYELYYTNQIHLQLISLSILLYNIYSYYWLQIPSTITQQLFINIYAFDFIKTYILWFNLIFGFIIFTAALKPHLASKTKFFSIIPICFYLNWLMMVYYFQCLKLTDVIYNLYLFYLFLRLQNNYIKNIIVTRHGNHNYLPI